MQSTEPLLFALGGSGVFGENIARHLGLSLAPHEERDFEDGEHKSRPLVDVVERDVYVIYSLYGEKGQSVNDKFCRLLFFIGAVRDAGAARVTVVTPYLPYGRKDRRTKPADPLTTRYAAQVLEAVGTDRLIALEVHNLAAFENAFRCPTEPLDAVEPLAQAVVSTLEGRPAVLVSPDPGGVKRADRLHDVLSKRIERELPRAFMEKRRSDGVVSGQLLVGTVTDRVAVIVDDLVSSGTTLLRAAQACRDHGASAVIAVVTHGVFTAGAEALFSSPAVERLLITNSVAPRMSELWGGHVEIVPVESLIAEAIGRLATGSTRSVET